MSPHHSNSGLIWDGVLGQQKSSIKRLRCFVILLGIAGLSPRNSVTELSTTSFFKIILTDKRDISEVLGVTCWSISFIFLYETWKEKIGGRSCSSFNPDLTNMVLSCIDTIEVILSDLTGVAGSVILLFSWRQGQERRCRDVELREWDIRQIMRRELCAESDGAGALRN